MLRFLIKIRIYLLVLFFICIIYSGVNHILTNGKIPALDVLDTSVISLGTSEIKKHKVIITGITRDDMNELSSMKGFIEKIGKDFDDYRVVIFENDSKDGSKEFLAKWQSKNNKVRIISHDFHNEKRPSLGFLANARNYYLNEIENNPKYEDFDILMIVDMDMPYGFDIRGISHSFANIDKWDAVCANGIYTEDGKMWDTFAFRNDEFPEYSEENMKKAHKIYPVGSDFVKVQSCFNGMAFYKRKFLNTCRYSSETWTESEHFKFHKCFADNGGKMLMNPSQLLLYSHYPNIKDEELPKIKIIRKLYRKYRRALSLSGIAN